MENTVKTILIPILLLFALGSQAQTEQRERKGIYQLTGIVLGEDSTSALPGVHVYVPKRGDGTTTNYLGYFSLPVLEGDELVFSAVGYINKSYKVPRYDQKNITLLVDMVTDTTFLDEVDVMPFPTEEVFKEAILALNLPPEDELDNEHLNQELLTLMMRSAPMNASMNYRFYMDEVINQQTYRGGIRPNPFLNPFNWAKFIRDLKKRNK